MNDVSVIHLASTKKGDKKASSQGLRAKQEKGEQQKGFISIHAKKYNQTIPDYCYTQANKEMITRAQN